jgi:hypothetical protein
VRRVRCATDANAGATDADPAPHRNTRDGQAALADTAAHDHAHPDHHPTTAADRPADGDRTAAADVYPVADLHADPAIAAAADPARRRPGRKPGAGDRPGRKPGAGDRPGRKPGADGRSSGKPGCSAAADGRSSGKPGCSAAADGRSSGKPGAGNDRTLDTRHSAPANTLGLLRSFSCFREHRGHRDGKLTGVLQQSRRVYSAPANVFARCTRDREWVRGDKVTR